MKGRRLGDSPQGKRMRRRRGLIQRAAWVRARLAESESRLEGLLAAVGDGVCLHENGTIFWANAPFDRIFGYEPGETVGKHLSDLHAPVSHESLADRLSAPPEDGAHWEHVGLRKDGATFPALVSGAWVQWGGRRARLGLVRDLTDQRRREDEARQTAENLLMALGAAGMSIWDWNLQTNEIVWFRAEETLKGYKKALYKFSAKDALSGVHPEDRARVDALQTEAIEKGTPYRAEFRLFTPAGAVRWASTRGQVVKDAQGRSLRMVGVQMDVSERREMEARLGIAERLAAVGTLAAGVAHEINNPLMYVTGNVEVANRVLRRLREAESLAPLVTGPLRSSWDELGSALQAAQEGAERVRVIVRDLKVLSRAQETPAKPMNVRAVVEASLTVASNAIANRAKLIKEIEDVPAVMGQESRLGQVVLNLLMNAVHAIPEGNPAGHIIRVVTSTDAQGRVVIEVGDSGEGIPPDVLSRIFDPFFTTKDVGAGTGLGLSISLSLVKSMGGAIDVQSEPGVGSTFRVVLPAASK